MLLFLLTLYFSRADTDRTIHYSNVNKVLQEWPCNEVLAFSNSLSHEPLEKVKAGREKFREIVNRKNQSKDDLVKSLRDELLCNREKHWPDEELHRRMPKWSEQLSSICVRIASGEYGTRYVSFTTKINFNDILFTEREQ